MFGRDYAHVDVIVCTRAVWLDRRPILSAIALNGFTSDRFGRFALALKEAKAWGVLWWLLTNAKENAR